MLMLIYFTIQTNITRLARHQATDRLYYLVKINVEIKAIHN